MRAPISQNRKLRPDLSIGFSTARVRMFGWRAGITLAGKGVEDDVGGAEALGDRLGAAATADGPSVSTAVRMSTICRLPSSAPASLQRTRSIAAGSARSLNGV
jgi:hypothetical protein